MARTNGPRGAVRIGISGWRYPPWRGTFYPEGLAQSRELEYASRKFRTIELNGSFYSLQRPSSYRAWHDATPDDFVFAVKGGRFITHMKKLRDVRLPMANFFASGVLALEAKLGPILWQLPPMLKFDAALLDEFFTLLPRSTQAAAALARDYERKRVRLGVHTDVDADRPLRHTIEVRHDSFIDPAFIALLRKHGIALCVADNARDWPVLEDVTADFVYARLHGHTEMYASGYSAPALDGWAARIRAWRRGTQPAGGTLAAPGTRPPPRKSRDIYVYFDNDAKIRAPYDALNLDARIHGGPRVPFPRAHRARGEMPRQNWGDWRGYGPEKRDAPI
jgi:uncharacterized protein YecE (DUF72 family)